MLNNHLKLMLVLMFILAVPACSIAGDDDTIWPAAVGNYWIYEVETQMGDAPVLNTIDTSTIEAKITWGGHTWYGDKEEYGGEYRRNAKGGMYRLRINDEHPDGKAELLVEYPVKVGSSWTEADSTTVIVEDLDETVTVPAGKFDGCYRFKMAIPGGMTGTMWLKPGVGIVKTEYKVTQGEMEVRQVQQLKEYHLK